MLFATVTDDHLLNLDPADFAAFPSGLILLKRDGTVLGYNNAEAKFARREQIQTIGLNFWTDVAPCTAVQGFKGRFEAFAAQSGNGVERFDFGFNFPWGMQYVGIAMIRRADRAAITILVTVKNAANDR